MNCFRQSETLVITGLVRKVFRWVNIRPQQIVKLFQTMVEKEGDLALAPDLLTPGHCRREPGRRWQMQALL